MTESDPMASRKRSIASDKHDVFNPEAELLLPARFAVRGKVLGSLVRQLAIPARRVRCQHHPFAIRRVSGYETLGSGEILKIISAKTGTRLEADLIHLLPGTKEPEQITAALERGEGW